MTDTLDFDTKLDTAAKRALIERELRSDPNRPNREIARALGNKVDHKTVAATRERMGIATPLGNSPPTATERRAMLIAGGEDLIARDPDMDDGKTAEEVVDDAVAAGKISLAPEQSDEQGYCYVIPHQARIECCLTTDGHVEIIQEGQHGPDDGDRIHVALGNAVALARCVLFAAGFKNVGISTCVSGGHEDVEDGDTAGLFDYKAGPKPGYGPVRS